MNPQDLVHVARWEDYRPEWRKDRPCPIDWRPKWHRTPIQLTRALGDVLSPAEHGAWSRVLAAYADSPVIPKKGATGLSPRHLTVARALKEIGGKSNRSALLQALVDHELVTISPPLARR